MPDSPAMWIILDEVLRVTPENLINIIQRFFSESWDFPKDVQLGIDKETVLLLNFHLRPAWVTSVSPINLEIEGEGHNSLGDKYKNEFGTISITPTNALESHVKVVAKNIGEMILRVFVPLGFYILKTTVSKDRADTWESSVVRQIAGMDDGAQAATQPTQTSAGDTPQFIDANEWRAHGFSPPKVRLSFEVEEDPLVAPPAPKAAEVLSGLIDKAVKSMKPADLVQMLTPQNGAPQGRLSEPNMQSGQSGLDRIRQKLGKASDSNRNKQGSSRKRRDRRDGIEGVALARIALEVKKNCPTPTDAALWASTDLTTFNCLEKSPEVEKLFNELKDKPDLVAHLKTRRDGRRSKLKQKQKPT